MRSVALSRESKLLQKNLMQNQGEIIFRTDNWEFDENSSGYGVRKVNLAH